MIKNERRKLLISEPSRLISNILEKKLSDEGYKVLFLSDELNAIEEIGKDVPDCILLNRQLKKITGAELCCVIKSSCYSNIPVIIYSTDENKKDFMVENSGADDIVYFSFENINLLINSIDSLLNSSIEFDFTDLYKKNNDDFNTSVLCAINSMEKNRFYYYTLRALFDLSFYMNDLDTFIKNVLLLLYKICNFDMAVFILNQNPFTVYITKVKGFLKKDKNDLLKICRSDFRENLDLSKKYSFVEKEIDFFPEEVNFNKKNIKSYRSFSFIGDDFLGTVHIASLENNFFKDSVCDNILYFVEKASVMMDQAVKYKKLNTSGKQMRSAFSKFVPDEIIDELLSSEIKMNTAINEKRKVAILICDIRNFTTISEINEPENVVSFLNGYFKKMVKVIKKHGGTIDKFIGDAIMALFGAPISYADNAERALKAACEMIALLPKISCDLIKIPDGLNFDIGIGIHYGEVIVGSIGCEDKSDYTVIGDSANLTSRLEGLTKIYGAKIIISQAVKDELNDKFNLLNVDKVKVKGKHNGVPIYRVDLLPLPEEYTDNYSKGLSLYKNGAWNLALGYFKKAEEYVRNDKSACLMINRCEEFIKNPPANWEGAISLTSK